MSYKIKKQWIGTGSIIHLYGSMGAYSVPLEAATYKQLKMLHEMGHPAVEKEEPKTPKKK